jgi:hypothetical protein
MMASMATKTKARAVPMAEFAAAIEQHYLSERASRSILYAMRKVLRILNEDLGMRTTADLDGDLVGRFFARREGSERNRHHMATVFRSMCRRAAAVGLLPAMPPFPAIRSSRSFPRGSRTTPPPAKERDTLLLHLRRAAADGVDAHRLSAITAIVALAGTTLRDALRLPNNDVDLAAGIMWIRRPAGMVARHPIRIPMPPELISTLAGWWPNRGPTYLFSYPTKDKPLGTDSDIKGRKLCGHLKAAVAAAGIKTPITFGKLRRFHAENAVRVIPTGSDMATRPEPTRSPEPGLPTIRLGRSGEPCYIDGCRMRTLTASQRDIIEAILAAGPDGLDAEEIEYRTGLGGWRQTLLRLKRNALWDRIIIFPGVAYGRYYRIAAVLVPD